MPTTDNIKLLGSREQAGQSGVFGRMHVVSGQAAPQASRSKQCVVNGT
jgi:hypothetical protein